MKIPDFNCHTTLPAKMVTVTFRGLFQGRTVTWEMSLGTLEHFRTIAAHAEEHRCPFIEISEGLGECHQLKVGLELELIDEPVIRKTIIMIRNYKRLATGKLEFCRDT